MFQLVSQNLFRYLFQDFALISVGVGQQLFEHMEMISPDEVKDLKAQFEAIDTSGEGLIDIKELTTVLEK